MRQITEQSVRAFFNRETFNKANMRVSTIDNGMHLFLHGNLIAKIENNQVYISDCGWQTPTTKERLNGVLNHCSGGYIYQENFVWYYVNSKGVTKVFLDGWNLVI